MHSCPIQIKGVTAKALIDSGSPIGRPVKLKKSLGDNINFRYDNLTVWDQGVEQVISTTTEGLEKNSSRYNAFQT